MWFPFLSDPPESRTSKTKARRKSRDANYRKPAPRKLSVETLEDRYLPSFSPMTSYAVGPNPQAVTVGDFNGDNQVDLAVANYGSNSVSILLGSAAGTFQDGGSYATGSNPRSVAVGDFNDDGKLDLATANHGGNDVSVLLGNGDGSFDAPLSVPIVAPTVVDPPLAVAVGDFNDDGKLDLAVTSNYTYYWWGGGGGWYGYGYYGGGGGGSVTNGYVNVLLGNGDGTFQAPNTTQLNYGNPYSVGVGDFNEDSKLDVVTADIYVDPVTLLLGNGNGTLQYPVDFGSTGADYVLAIGDLNGDSHLDVATANGWRNTVTVLLGTGAGGFQPYKTYTAGGSPTSLAIADFNSDSIPDLVTANSSGSSIGVLFGKGDGSFTLPINYAAGLYPSAVTAADFNGDGRPDVAVTNDGSGTTSILLNDGVWPSLDAPGFAISDVIITEGNTGTTTANFIVSLAAAHSSPLTVDYATLNGGATAGNDYEATSGTLTFAPGETSQMISVPVYGDRVTDYTEYFYVNLYGAFVTDGQGRATIQDDEPYLTIDYGGSAPEGNTGTTDAIFTVRLSNAYDVPVTVNYSTADGDTDWWYWSWYEEPPAATAGSDYQAVSGTLTFAPGETVQNIAVPIYGDRDAEPYEYFSLDLSGAVNAYINYGHAVWTIEDDEPYISIGYGTSVTEGNTGTTNAVFTVNLSNATDIPVTVDYATVDGSALAGSDYVAAVGTLTFAPGETSMTITVLINGDTAAEYSESFSVQLSNPTYANLSSAWGYGTIVDNEPRLSINALTQREGNSGVTYFTFTVNLSAASTETVTVNYATQDGSATAGSDYQAQSGTLTFAPGETSKTITIAVYGDTRQEGDEYFYVALSDPSSNAMYDNSWGVGWIQEDDTSTTKGNRGGKKK